MSNPLQGHPNAKRLRTDAGQYLKRLREAAGLTQQDVARAVGLEYYTMVSQVERGIVRLPPERMLAWATTLGAEPQSFGRRLLQHYDPYMWQLLFGPEARQQGSRTDG